MKSDLGLDPQATSEAFAGANGRRVAAIGGESITGRDDYILLKALAFAIASYNRLPTVERPNSDRDDTLLLLENIMVRPDLLEPMLLAPARKLASFI